MEKDMRDLDKIRENYEFQLGGRQVRLLGLGLAAACLLIFLLGFLTGRHFPARPAPPEYASAVTTPLQGEDLGAEGKTSSPGFSFDFFEELSSTSAREQASGGTGAAKEPGEESRAADKTPRAEEPAPREKPQEAVTTEKTVTAEATPTRPPLLSGYTIQVGAFEDPEGAQKLSEQLRRKHYASYVLAKTVPGKGTWHRVRVGRFQSRDEADATAKLLEEREGLTTFVTLYARN